MQRARDAPFLMAGQNMKSFCIRGNVCVCLLIREWINIQVEPNFHFGLVFALLASVLSFVEGLSSLLSGRIRCCFCDWVPIVVCLNVWSIYKWKALLKIWPPLAVRLKAEAWQSSRSPTGQMTGAERDKARLADLTSSPFPIAALCHHSLRLYFTLEIILKRVWRSIPSEYNMHTSLCGWKKATSGGIPVFFFFYSRRKHSSCF